MEDEEEKINKLSIKSVYLHRRNGKEDNDCPLFLYLTHMITKELIHSFIDEKLAEDDVFAVEVKVSAANQIYVEIDAFSGVNINYCVSISKMIEGELDREEEDFELEVSSSSASAPFKVLNHYRKNEGKEVELFTQDNKKIEGILKDVTEDGFLLETERKEKVEGKKKKQLIVEQLPFKYDEVRSVKLVIKFK